MALTDGATAQRGAFDSLRGKLMRAKGALDELPGLLEQLEGHASHPAFVEEAAEAMAARLNLAYGRAAALETALDDFLA